MLKVVSKKINDVVWMIKTNELSKEDIEYIENFNPVIFFNNVDCRYWAFDEKLPSGRWIENMEFDNELTSISAIIL